MVYGYAFLFTSRRAYHVSCPADLLFYGHQQAITLMIGGHVCQRIGNMAAATAAKPLAMYIKRSGTSQHPSKRTQSCAVARTLNGCNHRLRMDRFCFLSQRNFCYIHPGTNVDTTNAVEKNSIIEFLSTMGCIVLAYPRAPFFGATRLNSIQLRLPRVPNTHSQLVCCGGCLC